MEIDVEFKNDIAILKLMGDLDVSTADTLVDTFIDTKNDYQKIVLDFSEVNFVDSIGIVNIIKLLKNNDNLSYSITNVQDDVKEIFDILNLKEVLGQDTFIDSKQKSINYLKNKC